MTLARVTVTADGALDQLGWSITAQGQARQRFTLDASGQASTRGDTGRLAVQRLTGQFGTLPIRLEQATSLQRAADSLVLGPMQLDLGRGRLRIAASRRGAQLAGTLELKDLPLDLAHVIAPIKLNGQLDAQARLSGSLAAPDADLSVTVRHAMLAGNPVPIDGTISAGWHGRDGKLQARITGLGDRPLIASAAVPIAYRAEPFSLSLASGGALDAHLAGPIDLRRALDAGGIDQPVTGRAAVDLTVAGTVGRPLVSGGATLTGGRYADPASGVTLDAIDAKLVGNGSRLTLASLSATDGAGGRLTGQGAVDLAVADPVFEGSVTLTGFVLHRDEGTATADAAVHFSGSAAGAQLGGTVTIQQADLTIPDRLPVTLVNIPTIEINGGRTVPKPVETAPATPPLPIKLALTVTLPGQVLVRGRGLDSEWRGRLTIGGTADAPDIQGTLSLVRGRLDFLGRALTLSDGKISFPGGAQLDPTIDLTATATTSDLTATIKLTGTASKPSLALSSDPPLPQDEILARVLFDKNLDQLSAAQAIQLAQAVATLTGGGGGGIVDRIRKATGLDVINVQSGQSDGANQTGSSLSIGKYIGNNVLVTGEQGLTPSSSRAGVEIGITNHLSAKTSVGADADSSLGLNWKLDY
jgi:translocation and assembly module TamB